MSLLPEEWQQIIISRLVKNSTSWSDFNSDYKGWKFLKASIENDNLISRDNLPSEPDPSDYE